MAAERKVVALEGCDLSAPLEGGWGVSKCRVSPMAKALLLVASLTTLCSAATAKQPESTKARQLLSRSMERVPGFNVVAVILYRALDGSDSEQAKIEIAKDGRMHRVVLQPLSREGFESVDDGKQLRTLVPDHKTILVQESPLLEQSDTVFRLSLIQQNYTLKLEPSLRIAGREAMPILATPKHIELAPRRITVDAQTGFLLKLEVGNESGRMEPRVEVKSVDFPSWLSANVFQLRTLDDTRVIQFKPRQDLTQENIADLQLQFKPVVPKKLPNGFVVQHAQINRGRFKSIAVRITDGLVRGTVYESLPSDAPEMEIESATRLCVGPVTFTVVMDAPEAVRRRIAQAFAKNVRAAEEPEAQVASGMVPGTDATPASVVNNVAPPSHLTFQVGGNDN